MSRFLFLFALLFLAGCDSNRVYEDYQEFNDRIWKLTDRANFDFEIKDTSKKYNVYYNVRNSLEYPYARVFINYALKDSTKNELTSALASNYLFDQKSGRPLGRSGLGDVFDNQFLLLRNHSFAAAGVYQLSLQQFTRQDSLRGVIAVGIRVEVAPELN